jgi:hypothetical protein
MFPTLPVSINPTQLPSDYKPQFFEREIVRKITAIFYGMIGALVLAAIADYQFGHVTILTVFFAPDIILAATFVAVALLIVSLVLLKMRPAEEAAIESRALALYGIRDYDQDLDYYLKEYRDLLKRKIITEEEIKLVLDHISKQKEALRISKEQRALKTEYIAALVEELNSEVSNFRINRPYPLFELLVDKTEEMLQMNVKIQDIFVKLKIFTKNTLRADYFAYLMDSICEMENTKDLIKIMRFEKSRMEAFEITFDDIYHALDQAEEKPSFGWVLV